MSPEELASAVHRRPFVPFRLTLTEGSRYEIAHPELCMVGRRTAVVGVNAPDGPFHLFEHSVSIDLLHIVKLEPLEKVAPGNGQS